MSSVGQTFAGTLMQSLLEASYLFELSAAQLKQISGKDKRLGHWQVDPDMRTEDDFFAWRELKASDGRSGVYVSVKPLRSLPTTKRDEKGKVQLDKDNQRSRKIGVAIGRYDHAIPKVEHAKFKPLLVKDFDEVKDAWHFVFQSLGFGFKGFFRDEENDK